MADDRSTHRAHRVRHCCSEGSDQEHLDSGNDPTALYEQGAAGSHCKESCEGQ